MSNQLSSAAIVARQVTKRIDTATHTVEILKGIDFQVERGQFLAIMGASGSGKSTLLGLLAGLDAPTSGQILLDGADITGLEEDELAVLRGRTVGFVFQSYQLIPTLTAEENVLLPLDLAGERDAGDRARELLDRVGLLDRRDHYPVQLSGGEQQRVALARAFVMRPPILMADEPTGNLDSKNGRLVLDLLLQLNQREKTTLLLVTHDRELAAFADRIITLRDGAIVADELQVGVPANASRRTE
jgi:putative ABC transport system ATP-binding protein